jgi:radical SAM superfamily enzyme YgiQ (UPF0313 family)
MSSKVLLTHSYFLRFDPKQWEISQPYPPLATLYAASILKQRGFEVTFYDVMFTEGPEAVKTLLQEGAFDYFVIYDDGFNYLTKMCLTNMREAAFELCKMAKATGCKVLISSSDATDHYNEYLHEGADFVLIGEPDQTLPHLLQALDSCDTAQVDLINGIAYLKEGDAIKTPPRKVMVHLDEIPFPNWHLLDIEPYQKAWKKSKGYLSLNMSTTRGCPFKCNWCAKPIYGNRYNSRSPENVVEELLLMKQLFNFEHIWFCDDIFGLKPGWIKSFAALIRQSGLKFRFKIQSRADLLLHEDEIQALAEAGCENVWMGAESGSQKILDAMDKGITLPQIETATNLLRKYQIKPSFFIQFGYPGETKEDIAQTVNMINRLLPHEIGISVSYPLPGTVFYERVKQELKAKANWTDSDEMAMMFRNTYPPSFYKQLHRYVHQNYHTHLAINSVRRLLSKPASINWKTVKKAGSILYYAPLALLEKFKLRQKEAWL